MNLAAGVEGSNVALNIGIFAFRPVAGGMEQFLKQLMGVGVAVGEREAPARADVVRHPQERRLLDRAGVQPRQRLVPLFGIEGRAGLGDQLVDTEHLERNRFEPFALLQLLGYWRMVWGTQFIPPPPLRR